MVDVPLEPRLRPFFALANLRSGEKTGDIVFPVERANGNLVARLFGWVALKGGAPMASITDHMVPVEHGHILVRLYRPQAGGTLPLHLFIHGGGWCSGSIYERGMRCRDLAAGAGCVVASVDYRLAPENQYPTAPEDCYAALGWLVDQASELGIDPSAVSVGGESAGGNLAAVVALMARDRGGPALCLQVLEIPCTDLTLSFPSVSEFGSGYGLTRHQMEQFVKWYVGDPARVTEPYASPLHAEDLSGLSPAWVMTCEFDPLRDEGVAYAEKLEAAGVTVQRVMLEGHVHGSHAMTRLLPSLRAYLAATTAAVRAAHRAARGDATATATPTSAH
jgi:acetyl esterase